MNELFRSRVVFIGIHNLAFCREHWVPPDLTVVLCLFRSHKLDRESSEMNFWGSPIWKQLALLLPSSSTLERSGKGEERREEAETNSGEWWCHKSLPAFFFQVTVTAVLTMLIFPFLVGPLAYLSSALDCSLAANHQFIFIG